MEVYKEHCTHEFRKEGLFLMGPEGDKITEDDFTPVVPIENYHDLREGDFLTWVAFLSRYMLVLGIQKAVWSC